MSVHILNTSNCNELQVAKNCDVNIEFLKVKYGVVKSMYILIVSERLSTLFAWQQFTVIVGNNAGFHWETPHSYVPFPNGKCLVVLLLGIGYSLGFRRSQSDAFDIIMNECRRISITQLTTTKIVTCIVWAYWYGAIVTFKCKMARNIVDVDAFWCMFYLLGIKGCIKPRYMWSIEVKKMLYFCYQYISTDRNSRHVSALLIANCSPL